MASALAAFAYGLSAGKEKAAVADDDAELVDSDDTGGDAQAPSALAAFAQQQQRGGRPQAAESSASTLAAIADQVSREDAAAAHARSETTQRALEAAGRQAQAQQRQAVAHAVQQAIAEEQQYQEDAFEDDEPAARQAATPLVASRHGTPPRSVDRQVLQQRQSARGLQRSPAAAAATLKDKLSTFQFRQLSLTQRRVFLATLVADGVAPRRRCNMDAINELAKDKAKSRSLRRAPAFAKLDDARHCRFAPRFATGGGGQQRAQRASAADDSDDGGGGGSSAAQRSADFVRRMEAAERARSEQLRRTREEAAYLARVDKKECPACGNSQSYAELSQKRKKCPNCGVAYRNRVAWSDIADQFLARMKEFVDARQQATRESPPRSRCADGADGQELTWERVQDEFLGRVQLDLAQREVSRAAILRQVQRACSFAPSISAKAQRLDLGTFDERLRRDLEARKARQEQYKTLAGRIATDAVAKARAKSGGGGSAPSFQERLRLDLEKRREREREREQSASRRRPEQTRVKW